MSPETSIDPYSVTVVLSINGPNGPAFTGMPPMVGPGGGVGDVATEPWRTGLPLNLLGSVTGTAAGAAATGFAEDRLRTFARSSAFSFSILSRRAITSSSVADRAAPLNENRQRAAQAVPERSLFLIVIPHVRPDSTSERGQGKVYQMPYGRPGDVVSGIFVTCRKNGTWILLRCSNLTQVVPNPYSFRLCSHFSVNSLAYKE